MDRDNITAAEESEEEKRKRLLEKIKNIIEANGYKHIKEIGHGGFGSVSEVEKNGKHFAMKIILDSNKNDDYKEELVKEFRGKNIVKIMFYYIGQPKQTNEKYYFYIMERSYIGELRKLDEFLYKYLIFEEPFLEKLGDNLTRYLIQQMVTALKTFYLGNLVHFDIKPNNILIYKNLTLKLIDFSLLKKIIPSQKEEIEGGTFGYRTPESYSNKEYNIDDLQKQDYYAIGMTIYFLKYGELPFDNFQRKKFEVEKAGIKKIIYDEESDLKITTNSIELAMDKIKQEKYQDKDFTDFLCNLIQHKPEDQLNFEQIIRNKWLNKNTKEIEKIININEANENNII